MKYIILFFLAIMAFGTDCHAQFYGHRPHPRRQQHQVERNSNASFFDAKKMEIDGTTLKYRVATISGKSNSAPILVVYLHSWFQRGTEQCCPIQETCRRAQRKRWKCPMRHLGRFGTPTSLFASF